MERKQGWAKKRALFYSTLSCFAFLLPFHATAPALPPHLQPELPVHGLQCRRWVHIANTRVLACCGGVGSAQPGKLMPAAAAYCASECMLCAPAPTRRAAGTQVLFRLRRPAYLINSTMFIEDGEGTVLGEIKQRWHPFKWVGPSCSGSLLGGAGMPTLAASTRMLETLLTWRAYTRTCGARFRPGDHVVPCLRCSRTAPSVCSRSTPMTRPLQA